MQNTNVQNNYLVCQICSHLEPYAGQESRVSCNRCGHLIRKARPQSAQLTLAFSLTALIFYIPANLYPFMAIELYGNRNTSTIWGGILALADSGSMAIAIIVFLASMLIPFFKLAILFYLAVSSGVNRKPKLKTKLYHMVEAIGRWSMLDIFLLAVLVAIMKLGPWTRVEPGLGAVMFALVVIFTMLASAYFDPQLLWKEKNGKLN